MTSPNTPRYRRSPDLDKAGAAWEDLETGAIRFALPGYDLNSEEARKADTFLALPAEQRAAQVEQRLAALLAEAEAAGVDDIRIVEARTDLGAGLEALRARYYGRDEAGEPLADLGGVEVFRLNGLELEMETNAADLHRRAHLTFPDGTVDSSNTALHLIWLRDLLLRPEVGAALFRWADEDAAADAAEKGGKL